MNVDQTDMTQVLSTLSSIDAKLDRALADVSDHEDRLRKLEHRSGNRWDGLIDKLLMVVVSTAVGYYLGQIIRGG